MANAHRRNKQSAYLKRKARLEQMTAEERETWISRKLGNRYRERRVAERSGDSEYHVHVARLREAGEKRLVKARLKLDEVLQTGDAKRIKRARAYAARCFNDIREQVTAYTIYYRSQRAAAAAPAAIAPSLPPLPYATLALPPLPYRI